MANSSIVTFSSNLRGKVRNFSSVLKQSGAHVLYFLIELSRHEGLKKHATIQQMTDWYICTGSNKEKWYQC